MHEQVDQWKVEGSSHVKQMQTNEKKQSKRLLYR